MSSLSFRKSVAGVVAWILTASGLLTPLSEAALWSERAAARTAPFQLASLAVPPVSPASSLSRTGLSPADVSLRRAPSPSARTVIHIEDVHLNAEAQSRISSAVGDAVSRGGATLIAIEGAFGEIDLAPLASFPSPAILSDLSSSLRDEGVLSGAMQAAIAGAALKARVVGVDDESHYRRNVDAYRAAARRLPGIAAALEERRASLEADKARLYGAALARFDADMRRYQAGTVSMSDHLARLSAIVPEAGATIRRFREAAALEKEFDWRRIESERGRLLTELTSRLDPEGASRLVGLSLACRVGTVRPSAFYAGLLDQARRSHIAVERYSSLVAYARYLSVVEAIDADALLSDMAAMESAAYAALAVTPAERALIRDDARLRLEEKLIRFELTPADWSAYKSLDGEATALAPFADFYREAEARDAAMTQNLLREMDRRGAKTAVLVTGGFHSAGVDRRLADAGVGVATVAPRLTRVDVDGGSAYLSVFTQERAPLDRLFSGRTLFLSPEQGTVAQIRTVGLLAAAAAAVRRSAPVPALDSWLSAFLSVPGARVRASGSAADARIGAWEVTVRFINGFSARVTVHRRIALGTALASVATWGLLAATGVSVTPTALATGWLGLTVLLVIVRSASPRTVRTASLVIGTLLSGTDLGVHKADPAPLAGSIEAFEAEVLNLLSGFHDRAYFHESGLTGDAIDLERAEPTLRRWSAPSKEALHLSVLARALSGDARAMRFVSPNDPSAAKAKALDILNRKMKTYLRFADAPEHRGFGGFLPWFLIGPVNDDGRTVEGIVLDQWWKDAVPSLDNGQFMLGLRLAAEALRAQENGNPQRQRLSGEYQAYFDRLARNSVTMFYDGNGRIRTEARILDTRGAVARANYVDRQPGYDLNNPYEGELFALMMSLFGDWSEWKPARGVPVEGEPKLFAENAEIRLMWLKKREQLKAVPHTTRLGTVTAKLGDSFSSHEAWGLLQAPYRSNPLAGGVYRSDERLRGWLAATNDAGLMGSANVKRPDGGLEFKSLGFQANAVQPGIQDLSYLTPYAAFPSILIDHQAGLEWLREMLIPELRSPFGIFDSSTRDGGRIARVVTWDTNGLLFLSITGGVGSPLETSLREAGKWTDFDELITWEYKSSFPKPDTDRIEGPKKLRERLNAQAPAAPAQAGRPKNLSSHTDTPIADELVEALFFRPVTALAVSSLWMLAFLGGPTVPSSLMFLAVTIGLLMDILAAPAVRMLFVSIHGETAYEATRAAYIKIEKDISEESYRGLLGASYDRLNRTTLRAFLIAFGLALGASYGVTSSLGYSMTQWFLPAAISLAWAASVGVNLAVHIQDNNLFREYGPTGDRPVLMNSGGEPFDWNTVDFVDSSPVGKIIDAAVLSRYRASDRDRLLREAAQIQRAAFKSDPVDAAAMKEWNAVVASPRNRVQFLVDIRGAVRGYVISRDQGNGIHKLEEIAADRKAYGQGARMLEVYLSGLEEAGARRVYWTASYDNRIFYRKMLKRLGYRYRETPNHHFFVSLDGTQPDEASFKSPTKPEPPLDPDPETAERIARAYAEALSDIAGGGRPDADTIEDILGSDLSARVAEWNRRGLSLADLPPAALADILDRLPNGDARGDFTRIQSRVWDIARLGVTTDKGIPDRSLAVPAGAPTDENVAAIATLARRVGRNRSVYVIASAKDIRVYSKLFAELRQKDEITSAILLREAGDINGDAVVDGDGQLDADVFARTFGKDGSLSSVSKNGTAGQFLAVLLPGVTFEADDRAPEALRDLGLSWSRFEDFIGGLPAVGPIGISNLLRAAIAAWKSA